MMAGNAQRGECMSFQLGRGSRGATILNVRKTIWVVSLLCGALCATMRAWGQTSVDGAISGAVVDSTGAAISTASVQVREPSTGLELRAATGLRGEFFVARVPTGTYQVTVDSTGFDPVVLRQVVVEVGAVTTLRAQMPVAGVTTSVTVTSVLDSSAAASLDDLTPGAVASVITEDEIDRLPMESRRWQSFALLMPVANEDSQGDGLLSFRGVAATQNGSRLDGADDDQSFGAVPRGTGSEREPDDEGEGRTSRGGASGGGGYGRNMGASYTFSKEAVREFRVTGQNYSALYGRAAGGIVTTVSKSGTNTLHGTGFYLARASAWGAANPFSIATNYVDGVVTSATMKPHDLQQQAGGSVGGAAVRNRLFYFYAYDQLWRDFPAISTPDDPGFYSLTATQTALLGNRGVSKANVNAALNYLDSLTGMIPRQHDQTINFGKLDWQATQKHRLSVQYNRTRSSAPGGMRSEAVVDRGRASLGSNYVRVDALLGRWLWRVTPKFSEELRVGYARDFQFEEAQSPLPQEAAVGPGGYAPEIAIGPDGFTFGTPSSLSRKAYPDEHKTQFADLATWVHGQHQLQIGAELGLVHDYVSSLSNEEGAFHYDSGATSGHAGGLVDWITDYAFNVSAYPNGGCPAITSAVHNFCFVSYTQSFGQQAVSFGTQEWAAFAQDSWRPNSKLTISAGIRYEYNLLPLPQTPNMALDATFGQVGATSVFPEDRNNIGPRAGVAWSPFGDGHGVIRVGYGLFFGRLPGATIRSALVNTALASSTTHIRITPNTVTNCPQVANQGFGYVCSYLTAPPAAVGATTSATVFDRRFRLPTVQQGSLSVEHEVGANIVASATYLMNLDRELANSVDINIAPSTASSIFQLQGGTGAVGVRDGETFVVPMYTQRVSTSYGPVSDIVSNANATYNALVLEARRRSRGGLEFRASWTWSKIIDFGQTESATPRVNGQFDPFSVKYDRGLSALNHPHRVVASALWQPRIRTPQRWLRSVANGWTASALFTETSGRPYNLNIFGGPRLSGGHESINGSGGAVYLPTVGHDTLRLPDTSNIDLRISRGVRLTERVHASGSAEIFNLANRVNYSGIAQRAFLVGTPTNGVTPLVFQDAATVVSEGLNVQPFGTFTEAETSQAQERRIQLGLRVEF
jgi:hypothetical protein